MRERTKLDQPFGHIRPKAGPPITDPENPYYHLMREKLGPPKGD